MADDARDIGKEELHRTGPDTLMGKLLRRFWHPVALAGSVAPGRARPLRVLSEDLTLYRGESGTPYLVGGRCAHRCTVMHTGVVAGEEISCMYHGWRYNGDGVCTDIPAEKRPRPNPLRIAGYPVREYAGLIFAWLGEQPAPEFDLPRKPTLEDPARSIFNKQEIWDCNWFQQIENSMDAVHLNFAHRWGVVGEFGGSIAAGGAIPDLAYAETESGVRQTATRSRDNVRTSDWTFPNNNHVVAPGPVAGGPWLHLSSWHVPVDDTHTMRFRACAVEETDPDEMERIKARYDLEFEPVAHAAQLFRGDLGDISEPSLISAQDYVAVKGQGAIYDRSRENLSSSDAGVAFVRRVFLRELGAIARSEPTKQWGRLNESVHLAEPPVKVTG